MNLSLRIALIIAILTFSNTAVACPKVGRLPDFNCDGKATIVVIGDSLVYGIGDRKNGNSGGYVLRAQSKFTEATFVNQGVPGLRTASLLKSLQKAFATAGTSITAKDLIAADMVVIDIGRNDFWLKLPALKTLRNIKRARSIIEDGVNNATGFSPLVVTAVLMLPNRGSQGPWIKELDNLIEKSSSDTRPADLRFNAVSKRLLSTDNIHPTSQGYATMARVFSNYLVTQYPKHTTRLRPDRDQDGIYDMFEQARYGTDSQNPDTDGDGILDGSDPSPLG